jgi:hypothetical protein
VGHIDALLAESQVVTTHAEILDPTIGTLLAFGGALDEQRTGRFTETAVVAMGAVGSEVGIGSVVEGWRGVEDAKGVGVGVLGMSGVEKVVECGARVRQVCTAGMRDGELKCECRVLLLLLYSINKTCFCAHWCVCGDSEHGGAHGEQHDAFPAAAVGSAIAGADNAACGNPAGECG